VADPAYRLDLAEFARRDLGGYFRVNDHFATELEKVIGMTIWCGSTTIT